VDLSVPARPSKPREDGITIVIDRGCGVRALEDALETAATHIDFVKFGWGTALITPNLSDKIRVLRNHRVGFFFGGTMLEAFLLQDRLDAFRDFIDRHGTDTVEVSDGTVEFKPGKKPALIERMTRDYRVISEVGKKDPLHALVPTDWTSQIQADLEAGAWKVICEARDSAQAGIFRQSGVLRIDLIEEIVRQVPAERLVFEAPPKAAQVWFIERFGPNVNLANIGLDDVIPLETLRLRLRSDTLLGSGYGRNTGSEWLLS
jgi:phosphosulfolactate synthase